MDDTSFVMQIDTTLEFENYWNSLLPEANVIAADEIEELEENEDEREDGCTEENKIVNYDYKKRTVEFWKSGKKGLYVLSTVQLRFKKVKSLIISMGTFRKKRWYS